MKTGRPRKLDDDVAVVVKVRMDIARATNIITSKQIAEGFELSNSTLRRYYFPVARALSLKVATDYGRQKVKQKHCQDCNKPYSTHRKCMSCTILIHEDPKLCHCGEQHGLTLDGRTCVACVRIKPLPVHTNIYG